MTLHGSALPPHRPRGSEASALQYKTTRWKNPTTTVQKFVLHDSSNTPRLVVLQPDETIDLPSEYDNAIHRVDCGQDFCHKGAGKIGGGWFCLKGHNGTIIGGLAPLLVRMDVQEDLDPALDPQAAAKKKAEADLAAAALVAQQAREAQLVAAHRAQEAGAINPPAPALVSSASAEPAAATSAQPPISPAATTSHAAPTAQPGAQPTGGPPPANARQNRRDQ